MADDIRKQLSNRIRELRAQRKWTQQKLAEVADLDYKSVQRLEAKRPKYHARLNTLQRLAKAFDIPLSELLRF